MNTALLAEAGYELSDITNFESLKSVAEDITARHATGELPFAAFSSAGLDSSSSWRFSGHLANMPLYYEFRDDGVTSQPAAITGAYLDNFKQIWDLYVANSDTAPAQLTTATSDQSKAEFGERQGRVLSERLLGVRLPRQGLRHGPRQPRHDPHLLRR